MKEIYVGTPVCVVGGGLIARAIALQLAGLGVPCSLVYERDSTLGQASAAAGGMLGVFSEIGSKDKQEKTQIDVDNRLMARRSYEEWLESIRRAGGNPPAIRDGLFVISNSMGDDDDKELDIISSYATKYGEVCEDLKPKDVPGLNPHSRSRAHRAIYLSTEGSIDSEVLLESLNTAIDKHPLITVFNTRVIALSDPDASKLCLSLKNGRILEVEQVVLANGVGVEHLLNEIEGLIPFPVFGGRGVSCLVKAPFDLKHTIRTPNRGFACGLHVVPRENNEVYIGATNRFTTSPSSSYNPTISELHNLIEGVQKEINVGFERAEIIRSRVGYRPVTIDRMPLVGRTNMPNILIATGTYRNGLLLTPLVAKLIAEEVMHPGVLKTHPFSPTRAFSLPGQVSPEQIREFSHSLLNSMSEPNGYLPSRASRLLTGVLSSVLHSAIGDKASNVDWQKRFYERAPLEENLPLLIDLISREAEREYTVKE